MGAAPQYKLTVSFDFWEEIVGLRIDGEMSEAGIGEAVKQRSSSNGKQGNVCHEYLTHPALFKVVDR